MSDSSDLDAIEKYLRDMDAAEYWTGVRASIVKSGILTPLRRNIAFVDLLRTQGRTGLRLYSVEIVSDQSSAVALALLGAYKSAMTILRSSVENTIRVILLSSGSTKWNSFDVKGMFSAASRDAQAIDPRARELIEEGRQLYKYLCAFVHTGGTREMTLEGRIRQIPKYDERRLMDCLAKTKVSLRVSVNVLFAVHSGLVRDAHPEMRDFILDGVSKRIKAVR